MPLTAAAHKGKQEGNWPTKFRASWAESSSPAELDNDELELEPELKLKPAWLIDMQCTCRQRNVLMARHTNVYSIRPLLKQPIHPIPHPAATILHLPQGTQDTPVIGKYVAGMLQTFAAIVD